MVILVLSVIWLQVTKKIITLWPVSDFLMRKSLVLGATNLNCRNWNVKFHHLTVKHVNLFLHLGTIYIYTICRKLMIVGHSSKVWNLLTKYLPL